VPSRFEGGDEVNMSVNREVASADDPRQQAIGGLSTRLGASRRQALLYERAIIPGIGCHRELRTCGVEVDSSSLEAFIGRSFHPHRSNHPV